MAQKKLIYDINGKVREASGSYYDDVANTLVLKNATFNSMSLNMPNGLAFISASQLTSSVATVNGEYVSWDNDAGKYIVKKGSLIDVSTNPTYPPIGSDISNVLSDAKVISLGNINSGNPLQVSRGGTGLSASQYPNGENLLLGDGTDPFKFLSASSDLAKKNVLLSNNDSWGFVEDISSDSDANIQVFSTPGVHNWEAPNGTKTIRVLVQGAGGGGGSGANNKSLLAVSLGGTGGSAGGFVDSGLLESTFNTQSIVVGSGGFGGTYTAVGNSGLSGFDGGSSSFGDLIYAYGGKAGAGGALNSSITSSGGASVSAVSKVKNYITYNTPFKIVNSSEAANNTISAGTSSKTPINTTVLLLNMSQSAPGITTDISYNSCSINIPSGQGTLVQQSPFGDSGYSLNCIQNSTTGSVIDGINLNTANDFTIEMWIKPNLNRACIFLDLRFNIPSRIFYIDASGKLTIQTGATVHHTSNNAVIQNTWNHVAFVKKGSLITTAVNGILSTWTDASAISTGNLVNINFGNNRVAGAENTSYVGLVTDIRMLDYALYLSNFTPPTSRLQNLVTFSNVGGSGGSGGALSANTEYNGGRSDIRISNNGTILSKNGKNIVSSSPFQDIYVSSGGGGGASAAVTETFDSGTLLLAHQKTSDIPQKDYSTYNSIIYTGSNATVVSTGSIPPINNLMSDGIVSSSYTAVSATGYYAKDLQVIGSTDFSIESWFYLINSGSIAAAAPDVSCYLFSLGYTATQTGKGILLGISKDAANIGKLKILSNAAFRGNVTTLPSLNLNTWNHIVLQKTGSSVQVYLNGAKDANNFTTANVPITLDSTNNAIGYSLGASNLGTYNFNGYAKELRLLNKARTQQEISNYYTSASAGLISPEYDNPAPLQNTYPGGLGGDGAYGSGGGGGGASTNVTGSTVGTKQGGNGGNGYVAVISYKY